ncbi:MAG: FHA domain-containing protein [Tepidisphaeraceae bacterium]
MVDELVSTVHAIILESDGKRFIRDLQSRTGTFLNGKKIHQEELNFGDEIRIGLSTIKYQPDVLAELPSEEPEAIQPVGVGPLGAPNSTRSRWRPRMPHPKASAAPARSRAPVR